MEQDIKKFQSGSTVKKEIEDLHQFFENWFTGNTDKDVSRFAEVMATDFLLIPPTGEILEKPALVEIIASGYNSQANRKIWVEDVKTRQCGDLIVATYYELQSAQDQQTKRISTAIFSFDPNLPNKCKWHQVHETWIDT